MNSHWWDHYLEGPYSVGNKGSWLYVELYSDFTVTVLFLNEGWSWQLYMQLLQLRKESLKKIQVCTGFEPLTSVPMQCSRVKGSNPVQAWIFFRRSFGTCKSCICNYDDHPSFNSSLCSSHIWFIYSYFEKGCRIKCTRQPRKVLWVVLSALFFKEIWKKGTRGHGHMSASAKGKQQK